MGRREPLCFSKSHQHVAATSLSMEGLAEVEAIAKMTKGLNGILAVSESPLNWHTEAHPLSLLPVGATGMTRCRKCIALLFDGFHGGWIHRGNALRFIPARAPGRRRQTLDQARELLCFSSKPQPLELGQRRMASSTRELLCISVSESVGPRTPTSPHEGFAFLCRLSLMPK